MRVIAFVSFLFFFPLFAEIDLPSCMTGWEKLGESVSCPQIETQGNIEGVNVVSGVYHEHVIDTATKGIDPYLIERSYFRDTSRSDIYEAIDCPNVLGWYFNYSGFICVETPQTVFCHNIVVADPSGGMLHFTRSNYRHPFNISSLKGYRNDAAGTISGTTHIKNTYIIHNTNCDTYEIHFSDGSIQGFPTRQYPGSPTLVIHKMGCCYQQHASGNSTMFADGRCKTRARDGTILNWVRLIEQHGQPIGFETSDQKTFHFVRSDEKHRIKGEITYLLQGLVRPDGSQIYYQYNSSGQFKGDDLLLGKYYPDGRFLRICYNNKKVLGLLAPLGEAGTAESMYRFDYREGYTDVYDADEKPTRYEYDDNKRITKVKTKNRIEKNKWSHDGCLLAKILCDVNEKPYLARRFHYDDKANIIKEEFLGNLTGSCQKLLELDENGFPKENGVERYVKLYTYTQDDFHLLTSEAEEGIKTVYSYVKGTNLLATKLVYEKEQIRLRQFRSYDGMGALSKLIEDDGNTTDPDNILGCTLRKIKVIQNRNDFPGVGQPEILEERYFDFDEKKEKLFKKTHYFYDKHNNCVREEVYDGAGLLKYSVARAFDLMDHVIYEKDAMGGEISRVYDANGNLTREERPRKGDFQEYGYDCMNRLLWVKKGDSQGSETKRFRYDKLGNCVCQIDDGGNETHFVYEGKSQIMQISAPTPNERGILQNFSSEKKYDLADRVIEEQDEEKNKVYTEYNIRGQPCTITKVSKEGEVSKEAFQYDLKGNCIKKVGESGATTLFTYDFLDRIVKTEHYDKELAFLGETSAIYSGFSLVSTTDAENVTTFIDYDGMGREKKITKGNSCVEKEYDSLGNVALQKEWVGEKEAIIKRLQYDFLSRVIEEKIEDESGTLYQKKAYDYDEKSNLTSITTFASEKGETTSFEYDFLGREIKRINPLGNETRTLYDNKTNEQGQVCHVKSEIDPNGNVTETFYDARERVAKIIKKDPLSHTQDMSEFVYNGCNHLIFRKDNGKITRFKVNSAGKQTEILEEDGKETRKTLFSYDEAGNLMSKETALILHQFSYDGWGRVRSHLAYSKKSSDAPLEITYFYNRNGKVLKVGNGGKETLREYDENGNLTYEKQESGLKVCYDYDRLGRRTRMTLPDKSIISYSYVGPYLFSIAVNNKTVHTYAKRDLTGKIIQSTAAHFSYDRAGKLASIQTPCFRQKAKYDPAANIIDLETQDPAGKTTTHFTYTSLNQISSENDRTFAYDASHNRVDGEMGPFNQLSSQDDEHYLWDDEGRLMSPGCAYDALNRLYEDEKHTYKFDGFNRRIAKDNGYFLYDGDNEIGYYEDGEFKELRILGEGRGADIGATVLILIKGTHYTPIHDIRGNIVCLVNSSNEIEECYRYSAFGEEEVTTSKNNPWRFASKRTEENGLVFFGRRHYSPKMARWTTPDPIWSPNAYVYVSNNPLTHFDLYGYQDGTNPIKSVIDAGVRLFQMAMRGVEWIAQNFIPIPGIRDVIECSARFLAGGNFFGPTEHFSSFSKCEPIDGRKTPGKSLIVMNGIRTTETEAREFAAYVQERLEGLSLYALLNGTNGFICDVLECIYLRYFPFTTTTAPERELFAKLKTLLTESPDEMIDIIGHSQAAIHIYNVGKRLTEQERSRINVYVVGPGKIIPKGMFARTINYISKLDLVPLIADPVGYMQALFSSKADVVFMPSSSFNPLREHSIMKETYIKVIDAIAERIK